MSSTSTMQLLETAQIACHHHGRGIKNRTGGVLFPEPLEFRFAFEGFGRTACTAPESQEQVRMLPPLLRGRCGLPATKTPLCEERGLVV